MGYFVLEAPAGAARRLWLVRPGLVPQLVTPPVALRRRFGDLYGWGAVGDGARGLTAATLLWCSGLPARLACSCAGYLVGDLARFSEHSTVRLDADLLRSVVVACMEAVDDGLQAVIASTDQTLLEGSYAW